MFFQKLCSAVLFSAMSVASIVYSSSALAQVEGGIGIYDPSKPGVPPGVPQGPPGYVEPGNGQPGYVEPGYGQPGNGQPGYVEPGYPGSGQPGDNQPGYGSQMDYYRAQDLIQLLYRGILFRQADASGLSNYTNRLMQQGDFALGQIAREIGDSPEFYRNIATRYSAYQIVENLYEVLLDRQGDPAGLRGWVGEIQARHYGSTMQGFVESPEFRNLQGL